MNRGDKIAFVGENELAQTALFKILMGELEPDEGSVKWGVSTIRSYLPKDNSPYFDGNQMELVDWLRHMESIQAVNKGLEAFPGVVLLASHDHELLTSTCNRVIAFQPDGTIIDKYGTYDDYLAWMAERRQQG